MLWSNTLLLPIGLLFAALTGSCLHRPDRATFGWMIVTVLFGLQLHLVAAVAVPVVAIVGAVTLRQARPMRGMDRWALAAAGVLAIGPYAFAEGLTGFANTRAIVGHLGSSAVGSGGDSGSAVTSLAIALDPMRLLDAIGLGSLTAIVLGRRCRPRQWSRAAMARSSGSPYARWAASPGRRFCSRRCRGRSPASTT